MNRHAPKFHFGTPDNGRSGSMGVSKWNYLFLKMLHNAYFRVIGLCNPVTPTGDPFFRKEDSIWLTVNKTPFLRYVENGVSYFVGLETAVEKGDKNFIFFEMFFIPVTLYDNL